jgi:hypothetical protein
MASPSTVLATLAKLTKYVQVNYYTRSEKRFREPGRGLHDLITACGDGLIRNCRAAVLVPTAPKQCGPQPLCGFRGKPSRRSDLMAPTILIDAGLIDILVEVIMPIARRLG